MSNGSWGLFRVFFWPSPIKTTQRRTLHAFVLWYQKKATQSVIKLFSEIIVAQCFTDTSQVFDLHGHRCPHTFPKDYQVERKEWSIDQSGDNTPRHNFPLVKCFLWILWQCRSEDFILCQFLTFVREGTWFLHASQLFACPKVKYQATQPGRTTI